jgi:thioredoxin reductase (NADPH)
VQLREAGITYLNKLGRFVGPHSLECIDAKGKTQVITSSRFVIAVGGRPSPLACPGSELAISSDDLFSLEHVSLINVLS